MPVIPWGRLIQQYERELRLLFQPHLTREGLQNLIGSRRFRDAADRIAGRMVRTLEPVNARTWREAAMRSGKGRKMYEAIQQELDETNSQRALSAVARQNARLIRSVPADIARQITDIATRQQQQGKRGEAIEQMVRQLAPRLTRNRIKLIARTEISKAETALTRERAGQLGVEWYQWSTSDDARVRPSHANLNNVLIRWSDPPQPEFLIHKPSTLGPGGPGEFPNCRCVSLPLVTLAEVHWPAKVYANGSITRIGRRAFEDQYGTIAA